MAISKHILSLIDMAEDDLSFARASLHSPRHARYHVGQSAEKAVKALLEHRGLNPGREHRFDPMAEMLPQGDEWRTRIKSFDQLSPVATTQRYPTAHGRIYPPPPREVVEQEIEAVERLIGDIKKVLAAPAPQPTATDKKTEAKNALARHIVATATTRKLEMPDNLEEKLAIYLDEPALQAVAQAVQTSSSLQDALDVAGVTIPKFDDV